MKEAAAIFGAVIAVIVVFTILAGGNLNLGTSPGGPFFNFGFKGPQSK